jgi:hypothetical protein
MLGQVLAQAELAQAMAQAVPAQAQAQALLAQYETTSRADPILRTHLRNQIVSLVARGMQAQATHAVQAAVATAASTSYRYPGTPAQEAQLEAMMRLVGERRLALAIKAISPWRLNPVVTNDAIRGFWHELPYAQRYAVVSALLHAAGPVAATAVHGFGAYYNE